jgi:hypothetical protein
MYLFVFRKGARQKKFTLWNHDLVEPERLDVSRSEMAEGSRLDFGFYQASQWCEALKACTKNLRWRRVDELADVMRGPIRSPKGIRYALHTTDYFGDHWRAHRRHRRYRSKCQQTLDGSELLLKRVGRGALSSLGPLKSSAPLKCTDCVLAIRPRSGVDSISFRLALRSTFGLDAVQRLLERGTGATYVTAEGIRDLWIPTKLAQVFPWHFGRYALAAKRGATSKMHALERCVSTMLTTQC